MRTVRKLLMLSFFAIAAESAFAGMDPDGLTVLHRAAGAGDVKTMEKLLFEEHSLFQVDSRMGVSALHKAVYSGNPAAVELLLKRGALIDLQSPSNGNTPLHDALYFKSGNDLGVIKVLLSFRPNVSIKNRAGLTPLDSAKVLKDHESLALLQQYYDKRYTQAGRRLMAAVKENNLKSVRDLTEAKKSINEPDEQGFTPLTWAAREGFTDIVKILLEAGANPNIEDEWMHATAGHKAAFWGRAAAMELLLKHGLNINARGGYNGYTALHDAVARNHVDVTRVLLTAGARRDIRGHDGKLPIDLARANKNPELVRLLNAKTGG